MKYQLIENFFETKLFQKTIQDYFEIVLSDMIRNNSETVAKGLYVKDGEILRDYYDMPYHIHILNGLLPVLTFYEKYLIIKKWIDEPEIEIYLKILICAFTFHDINKIFNSESSKDKSDLENAISELSKHNNFWKVNQFFPEYEIHKNTVFYLALATENRTSIMAEDYRITVKNKGHVKKVLREFCHLADSLASIQNEDLEEIEVLFNRIKSSFDRVGSVKINLPISYLKIRNNPYLLTSQNLLQMARKCLAQNNKKVLYKMSEGFIFWGEDINKSELQLIKNEFVKGAEDDIDFLSLTKIDAQKCNFGFVGSISFTPKILLKIVEEKRDSFLSLSPNSEAKIEDFDEFVAVTKEFIQTLDLSIEIEVKSNKLRMTFLEDEEEDDGFRKIYGLNKIKWLNAKNNKDWEKDFEEFQKKEFLLPHHIEINKGDDSAIAIKTTKDLLLYIESKVSSKSSLFKTYLSFIKSWDLIKKEDDLDSYIENTSQEIIDFFNKDVSENKTKEEFFNRYFEPRGTLQLDFLSTYNPFIPTKDKMCLVTGAKGTVEYKEQVAFSVKARGFSNRTITTLKNTESHISELVAEENKLKISTFKIKDGDLVCYYDFFEVNLPFSKEIIQTINNAKNKDYFINNRIEIDRNVSFDYNLGFEISKIQESKKVSFTEGVYWFIRSHLMLLSEMGIRTFVTNVGALYEPHKEAFYYKNAPVFLKRLGWDRVRLNDVNTVLDEINLIYSFGKKRINNTLLKVSNNRQAYFTLYYLLKPEDQKKVYDTLLKFYKNNKNKFPTMTVTEKLVEKATKIDLGYKSSAEETWLIRTGLDFLRRYQKQGASREDIIQKISGEIFRKKRMDNPNLKDIEEFAISIYDDLFSKDWIGKLPTINQEKDWIYQFAFVYRQKSIEIMQRKKALNIKGKLDEKKQSYIEENVKQYLEKNQKKYASQYLEIIKTL